MCDEDGNGIVRKENHHGVKKDYVPVTVGTREIEVPRRYRNPITERRHDLTNLSDDGYLKPFLALHYAINQDTINPAKSPVLSFDKDRWELRETGGQNVLVKREAESELGERVIGGGSEGKGV